MFIYLSLFALGQAQQQASFPSSLRAPPTGLRIWTIAVHMCPNGQRRPPTGLRMWTIVRGGHLFSPNLAQVWSRFGEENGQGLSSSCPRLAHRPATPNHCSPAFVQRHRAPSAGSQWPPPPISVASSIGASPCCAALAVVLGRPPPPPPSAVVLGRSPPPPPPPRPSTAPKVFDGRFVRTRSMFCLINDIN